MTKAQLRQLIRELLAQELSAFSNEQKHSLLATSVDATQASSAPGPIQESVCVNNNQDLAQLVDRIIQLAVDPSTRDQLLSGQIVFQLANSRENGKHCNTTQPPPGSALSTITFERGLLSERDCDALAPTVKTLQLGKNVRLTPLAADTLRQRGIRIQRTEPVRHRIPEEKP